MSCDHGYSKFWPCPECDCEGCGEKMTSCYCDQEKSSEAEDHRLDDPRHGQADYINRMR
jgi:hypothetical protein